MVKMRLLLMGTLWGIGLAGCSLFPAQAPESRIDHDFGPASTYRAMHSGEPVLVRIKSPSWVGKRGIRYRLLYKDPTAIHAYADNRWIAPPTALLKAQIEARLGLGLMSNPQTRPGGVRLVLVLTRFEQDFSTPSQAFVQVVMNGRLYSVATGRLLAAKIVNLRSPCAPDVQGAISGLSALAHAATADFVRLTGRYEPPAPKG
ncbi:MAG TPA: hypothetical protein VMV40_01135 [Acidiferrobacter sp.]|nr:hypothetical protein [Acidiferrobacter sp.]